MASGAQQISPFEGLMGGRREGSIRAMVAVVLALVVAIFTFAPAHAQSVEELVRQLPGGSFSERGKVVTQLAATGDTRLVRLLEALASGDLNVASATGQVVLLGSADAIDALTGEAAGGVAKADVKRIKVNNALRRTIRSAVGQLTLLSPSAASRLAAANSMFLSADPENTPLLDEALAEEKDDKVKALMEQARAAAVLKTKATREAYVAAIEIIVDRGDRAALGILTSSLAGAPDDAKPVIASGIAQIERHLQLLNIAQNVWYGVSLGSVLLLAAIGLAITFGVMGVINMAHGEMVMIGAYTTFVVQNVIRASFPGLFDWSLAIALPVAFLVTALIGIAIERGIIRWLYGRPLETLLATWGLSLILQQAIRTTFGASNREVGNPSWMSGSFDFYGIAMTWNRFWIVIFAMSVFLILLAVMKRTSLGLQMRAVTQNRRMASSMGIRTPWVDALTFGLGSGIAGLAGVALSQIDNVSPNLGQGYIIDSFMVVVFGGVGNLWGTLVGALTLGVVNKFLEPYAGAVLAKIAVLVFIILFIQKRPRGLFALRGRAVEA
jgi:urea transport system permease protein